MANRTIFHQKLFAILMAISLIFGVFSTVVSAADFGNYYYDQCSDCFGHGGADSRCDNCTPIECRVCWGTGLLCVFCDDGISGYKPCDVHRCTSCDGTGRSYYAEHLDIAFDVYASVMVNGEIKDVHFEITAADYYAGIVSVSGGSVASVGSDTAGDQNDLRLNGYFPIGTPDNPISYTVTLSNKTIVVDGVEVVFSSEINDITAWGSNSCPSGVGIDVAFGNVNGSTDTPALTAGSLTIFKAVSGVTLTEDQVYTFEVMNGLGVTTSVSVKVPAGNNAGSTTVELPFGTYTVSEAPAEDIIIGEDTYHFVSSTVVYPDSEYSFTLSRESYARQVNVTNIYEKEESILPPQVTEGTITVEKTVAGVTLAEDTVYDFLVGETPVSVTVKAGETSGSASVTLPLGTHTVSEVAPAAEITGADGKVYEFVSASAAQNVTISENTLSASASFTNTYEEKITEGTITVTKIVSGMTLATDTTFTFTVTGENGNATVDVTVKAGETSATSAAVTLPLGTYTVTENTAAVATLKDSADEVYELTATTGNTTLTLSKEQVTDSATVTNTYTHKVTKGDLRITKVISGMTPAADTTFTFTVIGENVSESVSVLVKAGESSGTVLLEKLPLGTYTVSEVAPAAEITGADGKVYEFVATEYNKTAATITADTGDSVTATNSYEEKITEGTLTITKIVSGVALASDTDYSFTVGGKTVVVTVKAGAVSGSASVVLPLGTYTVVENATIGETALGAQNVLYRLQSIASEGAIFTLTKTAQTASATFTNTYVQKITEGTVTVTKVISGVAPETDTEFTFMVGETPVSVLVKAGETSASATVTLPLGSYNVTEIIDSYHTISLSDNALTTDVDESVDYLLVAILYSDETVTISEDLPVATVTVTNDYYPIPVETEPVETEPVETEPVETEPVETEPVETEPVETEPVETEPVETEPVETEPVETEPVETEPVEVIDDEEVPLTDIPDEEVPLTGFSIVWYVTALFSGAGLAVVSIADKKKKENK